MKSISYTSLLVLAIFIFSACSTAHKPYAYDDIYYNPSNDPIKKVEKDPSEDLQKTDDIQYDNSYPNRYEEEKNDHYPEGIYQNRYTETENAENNNPSVNENNQTVIINNNTDGDIEYYDPEYAETVRKLNTPVQSYTSYDPYLSSRVAYTNDPFFYGPSIYASYNVYDPFVPTTGLTLGWNSWSGWNVGIGIGFGYSSLAYSNPYYNPWRPVYGYNPWNPYAPFYGGYGWGCDPFYAGYSHGYYHGYHDAFYYNDQKYGNSGRTYINTPRGSSGSRAYTEPRNSSRPQPSTTNYKLQNSDNPNSRMARPTQNTPNSSVQDGRRSRTPNRYANGKSQETYSKPSSTQSRPQASPTPNNRIQSTGGSSRPSRQPSQSTPSTNPRNAQSRPYSNDSYNSTRPLSSQPNQNYQSKPSYQSNPSNSMNRSRPSYNSTPSYSPSPSMGGSRPGRTSSPSRSTPSSRPRR